MISSSYWHRDGWARIYLGRFGRVPIHRWAAAAGAVVVFVLAYAGTFTILFHQAAFMAKPGDPLVVVFPQDTTVATAVEQLGSAGTIVSSTVGMPWFYRVEVIDEAAVEALAGVAWVMRIPGQPTLKGCFSVLTDDDGQYGR